MPIWPFSRSPRPSSNPLHDRGSAGVSRSVQKLLALTRQNSAHRLPRARFFRRAPCFTLLVINVCVACVLFISVFSIFCVRRAFVVCWTKIGLFFKVKFACLFKADLARYKNEDRTLKKQPEAFIHTLQRSLAHCPYEENVDYKTEMCAQMRIRDLTRVVNDTRPPIWAVRRLKKARVTSIEYFSRRALRQCMDIIERVSFKIYAKTLCQAHLFLV